MFRIRKEQRAVFADLARKRFEKELAAHLVARYPEPSAALGEEGIRDIVSHAVVRGERYGFVTEEQVCLFTQLLVLLGKTFDEDKARPWARKILKERFHHADQKLEALYEAAERMEPEAFGEDEEEEIEA